MYPKEMINIVKNFYKSNEYSIREVSPHIFLFLSLNALDLYQMINNLYKNI